MFISLEHDLHSSEQNVRQQSLPYRKHMLEFYWDADAGIGAGASAGGAGTYGQVRLLL